MIVVTLPNGQTKIFPQGTSEKEIDDYFYSYFPHMKKDNVGKFEETAGAAGHSFLDTFSGGLGNKAIAAGAAGLLNLTNKGKYSDLYNEILGETDQDLQQAQQKHPWASLAGSIVGGLGLGSAVLPKLGLTGAKTLLGKIGQATLGGATLGAEYKAAKSKKPEDIIPNTFSGGVEGAAFGGATELGLRGIGGVKNRLIPPKAESVIANQLTPEEISTNLAKLRNFEQQGRDVNLAETGGDKIRGLTRLLAKNPNARTYIDNVIKNRSNTSNARVAKLINNKVSSDAYFGNLEDIDAARKSLSQPFWEKAQMEGAVIPAFEYRTTVKEIAPLKTTKTSGIKEVEQKITSARNQELERDTKGRQLLEKESQTGTEANSKFNSTNQYNSDLESQLALNQQFNSKQKTDFLNKQIGKVKRQPIYDTAGINPAGINPNDLLKNPKRIGTKTSGTILNEQNIKKQRLQALKQQVKGGQNLEKESNFISDLESNTSTGNLYNTKQQSNLDIDQALNNKQSSKFSNIQSGKTIKEIITEGDKKVEITKTPINEKDFSPKERKIATNFDDAMSDNVIRGALKKGRAEYNITASDNSISALHGARKVINDMISAARRNGEAERVRVLMKSKQKLNNVLYEAAPSMKEADKIYAGKSALMDAQEEGLNFTKFKSNDELKQYLKDITSGEKDAFKIGVARNLLDIVGKTSYHNNAAAKIFSNPTMRNKLRAIFNNPAEYRDFSKKMMDEIRRGQVKQSIIGASRTDYNVSDDKMIEEAAKQGAKLLEKVSSPHNLIIDTLTSAIKNKQITDKNAKDIARILLDPKRSVETLTKIVNRTKNPTEKQKLIDLINEIGPMIIGTQLNKQLHSNI